MPTALNQIYSIGHNPRRRRGFTLVEMLVVIGIILVLIGLSVAGFAQLAKHSKAQHTKAVLETMKAMMSEYEASAGKQNVAGFINYWDAGVAAPIDATLLLPVNMPITPVNGGVTNWRQYSALVLDKLLELPVNRAILDKLPAEQVQKIYTISVLRGGAPQNKVYSEILDGYGHPLLFAPSRGVQNVTAATIKGTIQSDSRIHVLGEAANLANPNPRYFWMSAGADNDPAAGDDNQYSFDQ